MKTRVDLFRFPFFALCLAFSACQPGTPQPQALVQTPALPSSETANVISTKAPTSEPEAAHGELLISDDFEIDSPFCNPEASPDTFSVSCSRNVLSIDQAGGRRKVDIFTSSEMPIELGSFSLEVETLSTAAEKTKSDQNAYGFYFTDESGQVHALRLTAQYFSFETWSRNGDVKVEERTNLSFSPAIRSKGQSNTLRLDCSAAGCDLFANGKLAGRSPVGVPGTTKTIGMFASSNWDQRFGKVDIKQLRIYALSGAQDDPQLFSIVDPLTSPSEIFSGTGLSGAFNRVDKDGFHFSPVIPYGFYGVKGGPALGGMSVSATIKMEISAGISSSRYAGLVCHSSLDGMIIAVIRADGTYSIYRDTPRQPFSLLAQKASTAILPGLAENKLRLDCVEDQITFYINGAQVESLTNTRYELRYGRAGLFTKAGKRPAPDAVIFSDFSITEIR